MWHQFLSNARFFQFSLQQFQMNLTCSHLSLMTEMQSSYKTFSICTMQRQTVQYLMRELNTGKLNVTFIRNRWGLCLNLRQSLRQLGVMRWELIRSELCSLTNSPIWCESWWAQSVKKHIRMLHWDIISLICLCLNCCKYLPTSTFKLNNEHFPVNCSSCSLLMTWNWPRSSLLHNSIIL